MPFVIVYTRPSCYNHLNETKSTHTAKYANMTIHQNIDGKTLLRPFIWPAYTQVKLLAILLHCEIIIDAFLSLFDFY